MAEGRSSTKPAAEKSPSNARASLSRRGRITAKLVASTNEYLLFVVRSQPAQRFRFQRFVQVSQDQARGLLCHVEELDRRAVSGPASKKGPGFAQDVVRAEERAARFFQRAASSR
jgi:hypothetical protein